MNTLSLYAATVLIWGSTWLAITFQLGTAPATLSVAWRFTLSAAILFVYALVRRVPLRFPARDHLWLALEGAMLFGFNYVCVYSAEKYVASGLVAVTFSLLVFWNIFCVRVFFGTPITPRALLGALLGVSGVACLFMPELRETAISGDTLKGLGFALAATLIAVMGSMVANRNHRNGMGVVSVNAWAMLYGAAFLFLYAAIGGETFAFDVSFSYIASLVYLALFGSVLAFGAYITLMGRIGPTRASYTSVLIPIVALSLSSLFEGLEWRLLMLIGVALCLGGNLLVLDNRK